MLILGLDFETTGLDTQTDRIIEVGAVLWDTEKHQPVMTYSALTKPNGWDGTLTQEIQDLTGISPEDLNTFGVDLNDVLPLLCNYIMYGKAVVAHNGNGFDRPILQAELARLKLDMPPRPWIDTSTDINWPKHVKGRKLGHLAADHGFINPFPHRAVTDVLTMLMILSKYNFAEVLTRSQSPMIRLVADVGFDGRERAKAAGFYWDGDLKEWFKNCREVDLFDFRKDLTFKTMVKEVLG